MPEWVGFTHLFYTQKVAQMNGLCITDIMLSSSQKVVHSIAFKGRGYGSIFDKMLTPNV